MSTLSGSCLCGDVTYLVTGLPQGPSVCHCRQCRKQSGHVWSSAYVAEADIKIEGPVNWYKSSKTAKRGSCPRCASFLFWKADQEDSMSFSLGSIDGPTGLTLEKHIFVETKGDYYDITDGLPEHK